MNRKLASSLAIATIAASALAATATPVNAFAEAACQIPLEAANPPSDGDAERSGFERLSASCLKTVFLQCSAASERNVLPAGTAMACSVGYEALLRQVFAGDFDALLAWWQTYRSKDVTRAD